jgi:hypothetical protein
MSKWRDGGREFATPPPSRVTQFFTWYVENDGIVQSVYMGQSGIPSISTDD